MQRLEFLGQSTEGGTTDILDCSAAGDPISHACTGAQRGGCSNAVGQSELSKCVVINALKPICAIVLVKGTGIFPPQNWQETFALDIAGGSD